MHMGNGNRGSLAADAYGDDTEADGLALLSSSLDLETPPVSARRLAAGRALFRPHRIH